MLAFNRRKIFLTLFIYLSCTVISCVCDDVEEGTAINSEIDQNAAQIDEQNVSSTNETLVETVAEVNSTKPAKKIVSCQRHNVERSATVDLVNYTRLLEILTPDAEVVSREAEAECVMVMFYSTVCPFSCSAAPHYNAMARAYPDITMLAIDSRKYHSVNAQFAVVGVPTLLLFHNARPVAKFNGTEYNIQSFVAFVKTNTDMTEESVVVQTMDFRGPVPSVMEKEVDYYLVLSWIFIVFSGVYFFCKSKWCKRIVDFTRSTWREAAPHHDHAD